MTKSLALILVLVAVQVPAIGQTETVYAVKMLKPRVTSELSFEDAYVRIDFFVFSQILFKLQNKTQTSIEIDWVHASFVDTSAGAHRIVHEGVRYIERDKAPPPTVVPAGANIKDTIIPSDYVTYESGSNGGWKVQSIFEGGLAQYEEKTISVLLPIKMRGIVKNYQFTFRVEKDLIETAKRAKDRAITSSELARSPVSKKDFGEKWVFTIEQAVLACGRGAVFLIVGGTIYAFNEKAEVMVVDGKKVSTDLREIETERAKFFDTTGEASLRNKGLELCK